MIQDIFTKLTLEEIGFHLRNYANLYLKPIKAWKKSFRNKSNSYNFIILHIIYYTLLVLLIKKELYLSLQFVILEIVLTLVPFLIFYLPFRIFSKLQKRPKKGIKLFHLFLIIKFQIIPPVVFLRTVAEWSDYEPIYIIIQNFAFLVWTGFIFIPPLLTKIKKRLKSLWVVSNYVCLIIFLSTIAYLYMEAPGFDKFFEKVSFKSPATEYVKIQKQKSYSRSRIQDDKYLAVIRFKDSAYANVETTQFVTTELLLEIIKTSKNQILEEIKFSDSLQSIEDSSLIYSSEDYQFEKVIPLNMTSLDSMKREFNYDFNTDLNLFELYKDSSYFKSNKEYSRLSYEYLKYYENLYLDKNKIKEIVSTQKVSESFKINNQDYLAIYDLDSSYIFKNKSRLIELENKLDQRTENSNYLFLMTLKPIEFLLQKLNLI